MNDNIINEAYAIYLQNTDYIASTQVYLQSSELINSDTVSHIPRNICPRSGGWAVLLNYKAPICMIHLYRWEVSRVTGGVGSVIILC